MHGCNSFILTAAMFDFINYLLVHCTVRHLSGFESGATVDSAALKILDQAFGAHVDTLLVSL